MNAAFSDAITRSASTTKWSPAPTARPLTAQITGFQTPLWRGDQKTSCSSGRLLATAPLSSTDVTSKPVEKWRSPLEVKIATRVPSSSRTSVQIARRICSIFLVREFPFSGRSRTIIAIPSCFS